MTTCVVVESDLVEIVVEHESSAASTECGLVTETVVVVSPVAASQQPIGPGASTHRHVQSASASVWVVNHTLGYWPNVSVVGDGGQVLLPTVDYVSSSQITITHSEPRTGLVYLS